VSFPRRGTLKARLYGIYLSLGALLLRGTTLIANSSATAAVAAESGWRTAAIVPLATRTPPAAIPTSHDAHLLFVGRLVARKGCLWFVREVLPKLPPRFSLKVAGTIWHDSERAALADDRVCYLGPLFDENLHEAYRNALCVIIPNIEPPSGEFEGFGLVAPEASASGGVVLAAATGGLVDAVIDGETGMLVPAGDADAWAAKIVEVGEWPAAVRKIFIERAMESSRHFYSWERVADDVLKVYENATVSRA
jgi:glycosyltransferase involved in cell wall biosynthesis